MTISKPTLSIFTGGEAFTLVYSEENDITGKFIDKNIPLTNSQGKVAFNWGGITRTINVQGLHDGTGFAGADSNAQLNSFIGVMEFWANSGLGQSSATYTDSFGNNYKVKALNWAWKRSFANPNCIIWNLTMVEVFI